MTPPQEIEIMPYSAIVGQEQIKLALELCHVAPRLSGVLLSGERGTGKSTAVRSFSKMVTGQLPVTIPINATEDRVIGGWDVRGLMEGKPVRQRGLIEEAKGRILYVDEVNLLDDHIVNIILDVTSTGILEIQREGIPERHRSEFTFVGTMNPEEGGVRPQLLDRFDLMVEVQAEPDLRAEILKSVLEFDDAMCQLEDGRSPSFLARMRKEDRTMQKQLDHARDELRSTEVDGSALKLAVDLASRLGSEGHRGERVLILAARACAALQRDRKVSREHLAQVAPLALQHRRKGVADDAQSFWGEAQHEAVSEVLA